MKKKLILLFCIAFILFSVNCTKKGEGNELRYGVTTEPKTLDPLDQGNTADGRSLLFNVFEGLVKPDTTGQFLPCVAESFTIEQDGKIYNFKLRNGVKFHDGTAVTAEDIKFTIDTAINLRYIGLDLIDTVEIKDENTVCITLKMPNPEFLPYMTVGIVKNNSTDRATKAIGTGPFYIDSYRPQRNLVLKKFEDYRQKGIPHLDKVTIVFHENYDAMILSLRGGSIDGADITGSFAAQLDHRQFDIFHSYANGTQLLALNNSSPPFDNFNVRMALTHGIDVQNVIDMAFFGQGVPSNSPIIPGLQLYYENNIPYPYDPGKAQALLAGAGYSENKKLSFEITVPANYTMHVDTAQVIANQLSRIGIEAGIKLVDWDTWLSEVYRNRNYEATVILLDSPVASPKSFLTRYYSGNENNFINYNNKEFDRIFDSILIENGEEKRIQLYKEAQKTITETAASVFLQDIYYFKAFRSKTFAGVINYPLYVTDYSAIYRID